MSLRRRDAAVVAGLWAILVLIPLPVREVMPPDEPRFAEVASEMRARATGGGSDRARDGAAAETAAEEAAGGWRDWVVPHLAGRVYGDKPPLLFWAINLASAPLGRITPATARIPSALASLAVLLLTLRLGSRLFGSPRLGLAACLVLLMSSEFFQRSEWVSTDMLLAACCLAAATSWREALFEAGAGNASRQRGRILLGWLAAAAATLTKGPVGLLWSLALPAAEACARRSPRSLARLFTSPGPALYLAVVGGWLAASEAITGGGFIREVLVHQSVERYLNAWNNQEPFYFYLYQLPLDLAPWSLFVPAALLFLFASRGSNSELAVAGRTCGSFVLAAVIFFSTSTGKRGVYLLPAFPAAALLLAAGFSSAGGAAGPRRLWRDAPLTIILFIGLAIALALPFASLVNGAAGGAALLSSLTRSDAGSASEWQIAAGLLVSGVSIGIGASAALRMGRGRGNEGALFAVAAGLVPLYFLAATLGATIASAHQGAEAFGRQIAACVPPSASMAIERGKFELILFYTKRRGTQFEDDPQLLDALNSSQFAYVLLEEPTWQRITTEGAGTPSRRAENPAGEAAGATGRPADVALSARLGRMVVLARGRISDTSYLLLGPRALHGG